MINLKQYPGDFWAFFFAFAVVAGVFLIQRLLHKTISPSLSWFLRCLRILSLILLILILFDPVMIEQETETAQLKVQTYLDCSRSMSIRDSMEGKSRFDFARQMIQEEVTAVTRGIEHSLYAFAVGMDTVENLNAIEPAGRGTDLVQVLRRIHGGANHPDKAVIFSDGNATRGGDPLAYMRTFGGGIPIYVVATGTTDGPADLGIVNMSVPEVVTLGERIPIAATIFQRKLPGKEATVIVERDGKSLLARKFRLDDTRMQRISLEVGADTLGWNNYHLFVDVPGVKEEFSRENNSSAFALRVAKREPLRVLYVESLLRWTVRFLREALDSDEDIKLSLLFDIMPDKIGKDRTGPSFPSSRDELFRYDVLVLGDLRERFLSERDMKAIYDFVAVRGGGLAIIGGLSTLSKRGYAGTPLEKLLPVHLNEKSKTVPVAPHTVKPVVTNEGRSHPILAPLMDKEHSFPPLMKIAWKYPAKQSATVLVAAKDSGAPLLLVQRFGSGYVFFSASGFLWNWAFPGVKDKVLARSYFHQMWSRTARWLGQNRYGETRFHLYTEKISYKPGETARVYCDVRDAAYRPEVYAEVTLAAGDDLVFMAPAAGHLGTYFAEIRVPDKGAVYLRALVSKGKKLLGEARAVVQTLTQDEESERVELNESVLRKIAKLSGGRYFTEKDAAQLAETLRKKERGIAQLKERRLWDRWPVFCLLAGMLSLEWFVRRRKGLA